MQLNDAADNHILVVGATNYIDRIDPAILRPGRFDKKIDFEHLASLTEGFTCADIIEDVVESAARVAANFDKISIDQTLIEEEINRIIYSGKNTDDSNNNKPN